MRDGVGGSKLGSAAVIGVLGRGVADHREQPESRADCSGWELSSQKGIAMTTNESEQVGHMSEITSLRADLIAAILASRPARAAGTTGGQTESRWQSAGMDTWEFTKMLRETARTLDSFAAEAEGSLADGSDREVSRLILNAQRLRERADTIDDDRARRTGVESPGSAAVPKGPAGGAVPQKGGAHRAARTRSTGPTGRKHRRNQPA